MTLRTAERAPDVAAEEAPAHSVRARRWPLVALVAAMLALAVWATLSGPLVRVAVAGPATFSDDAPALLVEGYGASGATTIVAYEHHDYVTLTVPVRNDGPLTVSLSAIRLDLRDDRPLLVATGTPAPATVAPGESAEVDLTLRFDNCRYYHERAAMVVERMLVDVAAAGRTTTRGVDLQHPLVVRSPMIVDCPGRTVDRGDHTRR